MKENYYCRDWPGGISLYFDLLSSICVCVCVCVYQGGWIGILLSSFIKDFFRSNF